VTRALVQIVVGVPAGGTAPLVQTEARYNEPSPSSPRYKPFSHRGGWSGSTGVLPDHPPPTIR